MNVGHLVFQVVSLAVFLIGFFPHTKPLLGNGQYPSSSDCWNRKIGQLVIVLVDALRVDFVYSIDELNDIGLRFDSHHSHHRLLEKYFQLEYGALSYVAIAAPPTVTLPRIKALTSGSIPGYIDVLYNFGSSELGQDSILNQWKRHGRTLNFFGDETWLSLFPNFFNDSEGTTSFFVSDTVEVDRNVTRHLGKLQSNDWDVTILHYLGLDHIGHLQGPFSSLIPSKLQEMNDVILNITKTLFSKKYDLPPMVFILGDHGMSDFGGHGGSSLPEIYTPMIVLSPLIPHLKNKKNLRLIKQSDFSTTLAWLTGVSIPLGSLGIIMDEMIVNDKCRKHAQKINTNHIRNLLYQTQFKNNGNESIEAMRDMIEEKHLTYNIFYILSGLFLMSLSLFQTFKILLRKDSVFPNFFVCLQILRVLSQGSTSFIEEQHQMEYFVLATLLFWMIYETKNYSLIPILFLLRLVRMFNQTGDKWAHLSDLNSLIPSFIIPWMSCLSILIVFMIRISNMSKRKALLLLPCYLLILLQKYYNSSDTGVFVTRIAFTIASLYFGVRITMRQRSSFENLLIEYVLLILQIICRPQNSILFVFILLNESILWDFLMKAKNFDKMTFIYIYYIFGQASFFHQGNSSVNIAKVDLTPGFMGLTETNFLFGSVCITLNTFMGPILWTCLLYCRISWGKIAKVIGLLRASELCVLLIVVTIQRYHLFVWSVFSPKLLYEAMFSISYLVIHATLTTGKRFFN